MNTSGNTEILPLRPLLSSHGTCRTRTTKISKNKSLWCISVKYCQWQLKDCIVSGERREHNLKLLILIAKLYHSLVQSLARKKEKA